MLLRIVKVFSKSNYEDHWCLLVILLHVNLIALLIGLQLTIPRQRIDH